MGGSHWPSPQRRSATLKATPLPEDAPPSDSLARLNRKARLLMAAGRLGPARAIFLQLLPDDPTHRDHLGWTGFIDARLGLEQAARSRIDTLRALRGVRHTQGGLLVAEAAIHAELGDDPRRVRMLLERSHRKGWPLHWFHFTPLFDTPSGPIPRYGTSFASPVEPAPRSSGWRRGRTSVPPGIVHRGGPGSQPGSPTGHRLGPTRDRAATPGRAVDVRLICSMHIVDCEAPALPRS